MLGYFPLTHLSKLLPYHTGCNVLVCSLSYIVKYIVNRKMDWSFVQKTNPGVNAIRSITTFVEARSNELKLQVWYF